MLRQDSIHSADIRGKGSPFRAKCHEIFCCTLKQVILKDNSDSEGLCATRPCFSLLCWCFCIFYLSLSFIWTYFCFLPFLKASGLCIFCSWAVCVSCRNCLKPTMLNALRTHSPFLCGVCVCWWCVCVCVVCVCVCVVCVCVCAEHRHVLMILQICIHQWSSVDVTLPQPRLYTYIQRHKSGLYTHIIFFRNIQIQVKILYMKYITYQRALDTFPLIFSR